MSVLRLLRKYISNSKNNTDSIEKTLRWAKAVYKIGAKVPPNVVPPTQETTGYIIPTFYNFGEKDFAIELAK